MTELRWGVGRWGVDTWGRSNDGLALGGHRFRLTVRWYDREDLFPTYYTWEQREATYASTEANWADWEYLLNNIGGGVELDVDLTCDLAGLTATTGRDSITEHVRASEMSFTLVDAEGTHDPRRPPVQGRSRVGARVKLEVWPQGGVWTPLLVCWVDSWRKDLLPAGDPQVDVSAADALKMMAQAKPEERPAYPAEAAGDTTEDRVARVFGDIPWNDKWGAIVTSGPMAELLSGFQWDGSTSSLDHLHDVMTVEDGLLWVDEGGQLRAEGEGWRDSRDFVLGIDLIPGDDTEWGTTPTAVTCPTSLSADDNDLDILNAATVWRSTEFDTPVGDPPQQPDVLRRYASDSESISHHGERRVTLGDLPAQSNTRTQEIADLWVDRYKSGAQDIGEAEFDLVKRPEDAAAILQLRWGDTVVVRDRVGDTYVETVHEVVGVRHAFTPYRWEATVVLDRKVT